MVFSLVGGLLSSHITLSTSQGQDQALVPTSRYKHPLFEDFYKFQSLPRESTRSHLVLTIYLAKMLSTVPIAPTRKHSFPRKTSSTRGTTELVGSNRSHAKALVPTLTSIC